ncbi:MAG: nucleotidyltransferase family protein [Rickettsiales bacterium]
MLLEELRSNYKDKIFAIAAKYHAENIRIFGSVVRGSAKEDSDIDILVSFLPKASLLDEAGLERELNEVIGQHVDVIGDDVIREEFKQYILNEAVTL